MGKTKRGKGTKLMAIADRAGLPLALHIESATPHEVTLPHRRNRKKPRPQDGRKLRRYRRRWKVERLMAWLQNFRRVVVRYEYHDANFLGFVLLASIIILLRAYL